MFLGPLQSRDLPDQARDQVPGQHPRQGAHRIGLIEADGMSVYVARAAEIPNVLQEIGRLRELTFRDVGEGTGREIDLDSFDATYLHLFIWNASAREVVGAYRLGLTDELIAASDLDGLYAAAKWILGGKEPRFREAVRGYRQARTKALLEDSDPRKPAKPA
jgi:hypothetical protein